MTVRLSHVSMVYALMVLTPSPAGVMKDMKDSFVRLVSQVFHIFIIAYVLFFLLSQDNVHVCRY